MPLRDDQPQGIRFNFTSSGFNFDVDSVFNSMEVEESGTIPILPDQFLLLPSPLDFFLLLDGTFLLLLGS